MTATVKLLIFITDFADGGVVLPVWLTLTLGLFLAGWRRGAIAWLLVMGSVMAAIVLMKGAIDGIGPIGGVYSPSGHTATAAVLAGGAWTLFRVRSPRPLLARFIAVATLMTALAAAAVIGFSRVLLDDHTLADVLVAVPIGVTGAMVLTRWAAAPPDGVRTWPAALAAAVVLMASHGMHLSAETEIAKAAGDGSLRMRVPVRDIGLSAAAKP